MRRFLTVDILKWWAIAAVILIHYITSFGVTPGSVSALHWIILNQFLRFCVPVFVALSGFSLALKYNATPLTLKEFYTRRVFKLLPLYVFWSLVIFVLVHRVPNWDGYIGNTPLPQALLLGRADYQLYFVPLIFQLYVLFPLLHRLWQRHGRLLLLAAFLLQTCLIGLVTYAYRYHVALPFLRSDQEQYIFFGSWLFYFVLGMAFTKMATLTPSLRRALPYLGWLLTIGGLIWSSVEANNLYAQGVDVISSTRFTRFSVYTYATGTLILGFLSEGLWQRLPSWLQKPQVFLGQKSYLIYLSHTLWLRIGTGLLLYHQSLSLLGPVILIMLLATAFSEYLDTIRLQPVTSSPAQSH